MRTGRTEDGQLRVRKKSAIEVIVGTSFITLKHAVPNVLPKTNARHPVLAV